MKHPRSYCKDMGKEMVIRWTNTRVMERNMGERREDVGIEEHNMVRGKRRED
jgi:hypothetical protein